jgi:hypothetical protein
VKVGETQADQILFQNLMETNGGSMEGASHQEDKLSERKQALQARHQGLDQEEM